MKFDLKVLVGTVLFLVLSLVLFSNVYADVESPKKQIKHGVAPEEITCKAGLSLVMRSNGSPACLKSTTAEKLEIRGVVTKIIKLEVYVPAEIPIPKKISASEITTVPASSESVVNFYITDDDLNVAHDGIETVSTAGLFEFSIGGVLIEGPASMRETGPDTGKFYLQLELPDTINGRPVNQDDVVLIKYLDASDYAGEKRVLEKSVTLTKTFAKVQTYGGGSRIGHEFVVRLYEPDANRDSKNNDKISLSQLEYRGEGGIRTTLSNPVFDANSSYLIETGENTGIFEIKIEIPRKIDGKVVDIGDWYEIRYIDRSTPSNTDEKIVLKGKIG